jgi:hypothetical protein
MKQEPQIVGSKLPHKFQLDRFTNVNKDGTTRETRQPALGKWTDDEDVLLSKAVTKHSRIGMMVARSTRSIECPVPKRWTASVVHSRQWKTGEWTAQESSGSCDKETREELGHSC